MCLKKKNLGELHKEWTEAGVKASRAPHTDVLRSLATVVIRGVFPGLRRRRTGLFANLLGIVKREMRNKRPKNADELKATVKETWASIPPLQCHKLITSMTRRIKSVIKAKGALTKY